MFRLDSWSEKCSQIGDSCHFSLSRYFSFFKMILDLKDVLTLAKCCQTGKMLGWNFQYLPAAQPHSDAASDISQSSIKPHGHFFSSHFMRALFTFYTSLHWDAQYINPLFIKSFFTNIYVCVFSRFDLRKSNSHR